MYQSGSIQEAETVSVSVILTERFNILINQILENWKGKSGILRCHTRSSCRKKPTEKRSWNYEASSAERGLGPRQLHSSGPLAVVLPKGYKKVGSGNVAKQ